VSTNRFEGVLAPVITPFGEDLSPDTARLARHCQWLVSQGSGLAVFGTNSEANSLSLKEKLILLDALCEAGIDPANMMPGTGACALTDAVELTAHAAKLNCGGVLMLPPFYYKGVSNDGLFTFFAEVLERVGDDYLQIYLYHIPPMSGVAIDLALVERLARAFPANIAGIKDSSGDWKNTKALNELGLDDFRVFCGSESFLLQNMQAGGAGCISATANVNPAAIKGLYDNWQAADAGQRQERLNQIRAIFQSAPMIAALKTATAHFGSDPAWLRVRPPLVPLGSHETEPLLEKLATAGFQMPDI
jgi:4-hydroxy-tetrahydrodipicolinate synthase